MTVKDVEMPVMFGPVTRVGGGRAPATQLLGHIEDEAFDYVASSESSRNVGGNTVEVTRSTTVMASGSESASMKIKQFADPHSDRETRIDEFDTGAWAYITVGAAGQHRWVGMNGRVVEVGHGR